ncbi:aminoglycoside phosphotransferase family protein [uncultured Mucilaginibacter sp.]|uniref:phosphotransferase enzyme family protein n=1 Tax=uncultured Mucilaginibacter sp. TaxID=797541 RepID=UPI0025DCDDAF|nr:aminoglycoside phosphotransferase family protein [uncultured Mucilaginibacter sp.]
MFQQILHSFNLPGDGWHIQPFGSGLINHTWKVSGAGAEAYILQRINTGVFKNPGHIAANLLLVQNYLEQHTPGYLFVAPIPAKNGEGLVIHDGHYYRLTPFIQNSHTVNVLTDSHQACEAAKQFGQFTRLLNGFNAAQLQYTIPDFHNLTLRVAQFEKALASADPIRLRKAAETIKEAQSHTAIAETFSQLAQNKQMPLRVIHHDTKINNVLFDATGKGLCVIDLDTVMPGFYSSDVGDMMRTYLSPASEEEQDFSKITVREEYFSALHRGYMQQMGEVLSPFEKSLFVYSGKFIIYMQALRFLSDYLNNDTYYGAKYEGHNLMRAQNQLMLLAKYIACEDKFEQIVRDFK